MSEKAIKDSTKVGLAAAVGFAFSYLLTHPTSKRSFKKKIPTAKYKNVQLSPNIQVEYKNKVYWVHHWASYTTLYLLLFASKRRFIRNKMLTGFILGNIIQGLTYKDRFTFAQTVQQIVDAQNAKK